MISAFEQGRQVCEAGMSIHANPYRNTRLDEHVTAWQDWNAGWLAAKDEGVKSY